ncbi:hypothetical protein ElyMa_002710700 [Elysia marginata]|uniref:Uncharacterized protein n=1 Tax=Elysia marginata TaxID=1093978 RepID=A0AAV4HE07_9GAST|nr:hypothetical protein ElyMa_002710700 [Elysia marginata]
MNLTQSNDNNSLEKTRYNGMIHINALGSHTGSIAAINGIFLSGPSWLFLPLESASSSCSDHPPPQPHTLLVFKSIQGEDTSAPSRDLLRCLECTDGAAFLIDDSSVQAHEETSGKRKTLALCPDPGVTHRDHRPSIKLTSNISLLLPS